MINNQERAEHIYDGMTFTEERPYMPSNGTEGDIFQFKWCEQCSKDDPEGELFCDILNSALFGQQPSEWRYTVNGPCCTAFVARD